MSIMLSSMVLTTITTIITEATITVATGKRIANDLVSADVAYHPLEAL